MAGFRAMTEGTAADWAAIRHGDIAYEAGVAERMMATLALLRDVRHGFAIDRLDHCLQTATRAQRDGQDEGYVVCALLHDIGAVLAPQHHAEFGAMLLAPHVSEANYWMVRHHAIFQEYYFAHYFGMDRNRRDALRGHEHFARTEHFVRAYDQASFDPEYDTMALADFAPMVARVFAKRRER